VSWPARIVVHFEGDATMAENFERVCSLLPRLGLNFFVSSSSRKVHVPFSDGAGFFLSFHNDDKVLLLHSEVLGVLSQIKQEDSHILLARLMAHNEKLLRGKYVGTEEIRAEISIPLFETELVEEQLADCVSTILLMIRDFREKLADGFTFGEREEQSPSGVHDVFEQLRRRGGQVDPGKN